MSNEVHAFPAWKSSRFPDYIDVNYVRSCVNGDFGLKPIYSSKNSICFSLPGSPPIVLKQVKKNGNSITEINDLGRERCTLLDICSMDDENPHPNIVRYYGFLDLCPEGITTAFIFEKIEGNSK